MTNFLISALADAYEVHIFIFEGATFKALIPSLMKVFFENSEKLCIGRISFVMDLIALMFDPLSLSLSG